MTAEEKKMTREMAEQIVKQFRNPQANLFPGKVISTEKYTEAKGFLLGRESGIRESAEIAEMEASREFPEGNRIARKILALLPDGREKEKT